MIKQTYHRGGIYRVGIRAILTTLIVIYFAAAYFGIERYQKGLNASQTETMRLAIERAAVQCYAVEGQYPPDVKYLERHYGIRLNEKQYLYDYFVFSSNIRPSVDVIQRRGSK